MARQSLNYGNYPNDPGADTARQGSKKIEENFAELYDGVPHARLDLANGSLVASFRDVGGNLGLFIGDADDADADQIRVATISRTTGEVFFESQVVLLDGTPVTNLAAAPKQYVDGAVDSGNQGYTAPRPLATKQQVKLRLAAEVSLTDYDLPVLDGAAHPLSERFATLAAAQAKYSWVVSLTQDRLDVAFQAAINDLPNLGGRVLVPTGNYAALTPANLTLPALYTAPNGFKSHKIPRWVCSNCTLPRGMPGIVERVGFFREYRAGGPDNGRAGDALVHYRADGWKPDPAAVNREDGVLVLEATVPADATNSDGLLATLHFDIASKSTDASYGIRGIHGYATGDGGSANVRGMRTLARGVAGHDGVVTGAMLSATREGPIPVAFGGDGVTPYVDGQAGNYGSSIDYAVVAQTGPGIRGAFFAQAFNATGGAQPQTVFGMAFGAQALKPTVAAVDLHAGGTGKVMRVLKSDVDTSPHCSIEKDGTAVFPAFRSNVTRPSTADDAVMSFLPPNASGSGILVVWAEGVQNSFAMFFYRATSSPVINSMVKGSLVDFLAGGAVPTGTTGTDTHLSISATNGAIYVENRLGASVVVQWAAFG